MSPEGSIWGSKLVTLRESLPTDLGFGVKFGGPKWVPGLTTPDPCVPDTGFRALNGLDIGYPLLVIAPQAIYVSDPPDHSPQDPLIVVSDPSKMGHFGGPKWGKIPPNLGLFWTYFGVSTGPRSRGLASRKPVARGMPAGGCTPPCMSSGHLCLFGSIHVWISSGSRPQKGSSIWGMGRI